MKITVKFFLLTVLIILHVPSYAQIQKPQKEGVEWVKDSIRSVVLKETVKFHIYLPDAYKETDERFSVLYTYYTPFMPAAFHIQTGTVNILNAFRMMPKSIIIGFESNDVRRDLTPTPSPGYGPTSGGAGKYLQFMETELFPYTEKQYRTSSQRILYAHSIGGAFCLYALLSKPAMFQTVIASSPWFIYDKEEKYLLKSAETFFKKRTTEKNSLFITIGNEPELMPGFDEFTNIIERQKPNGLTLKFTKSLKDDHMTITANALMEGLRTVFANWPADKWLANIFHKQGLAAMLEEFKRLCTTDKEQNFLDQESVSYLANQLVMEKRFNEAIEVLKLNVEMFPEITGTFRILAWGYMQAGNRDMAIKTYEKMLERYPNDQLAKDRLKVLKEGK